jgi:HSP20 family molecular chaperone IbpA
MALVKWKRNWSSYRPSVFDEDFFWPELSTDSGSGLNVYETDDAILVEAAVSCVPEENVEVNIEGNVLT